MTLSVFIIGNESFLDEELKRFIEICQEIKPDTINILGWNYFFAEYCINNNIEIKEINAITYSIDKRKYNYAESIKESDKILIRIPWKIQWKDEDLIQSIIDIAWNYNKPIKYVKVYHEPVISRDEYRQLYLKKKYYHIEEKRDKQYQVETEFEYHYQYEELMDRNMDRISLHISGEKNLEIIGLDFNWIEQCVYDNYGELYLNKLYENVWLNYSKGNISLELFSFPGYSCGFKDEERISIKQLFDSLYKSKYAPFQGEYGNHIPNLSINKKNDPINNNDSIPIIPMYYPYQRRIIEKKDLKELDFTEEEWKSFQNT